MAVISFAPSDFLQATVVKPGFYPTIITKIEGPKASASGKSSTFFVDIQITDGPFKGKEKTVAFNTGTNSHSLLGDMIFHPDSALLVLDAAINGSPMDPREYQLDTDNLLHKPFDSQWIIQTVEGALVNDIIGFFPAGYGASVPSF